MSHSHTHDDSHNHDDCIGCGCYNPAYDVLLNSNSSKEPIEAPSVSTVSNEKPKSAIFYNGSIYPVQRLDSDGTIVDIKDGDSILCYYAMGIKDGKVDWIGMKEDFEKQSVNYDEKHDLNGKTILPGLIEAHCHIVPSAVSDFGVYDQTLKAEGDNKVWKDFSPFIGQYLKPDYSRAKVLENVIDEARKIALINKVQFSEKITHAPFWLLGQGVDPSLMQEVYPDKMFTIDNCINRLFFDEVELDRDDYWEEWHGGEMPPIFLMSASGHTAYVNKKALQLTWRRQEADGNLSFLEEYRTEESYIDDDSNYILQELAEMLPILMTISKIQLNVLQSGIFSSIENYIVAARTLGVTMLYDAGMQLDWANDYFLKDNPNGGGKIPINRGIRIGMSLPYKIEADVVAANKALQKFTEEQTYCPPEVETINGYWGSMKITSDGSNQGLTGYQSQNYLCHNPEHLPNDPKGIYNFQTQAEIDGPEVGSLDVGKINNKAVVKEIVSKKWPILIHANGNEAIDYTINAYIDSIKGTDTTVDTFKEKRNRIEHCSLLNDNNLEDMATYGIQPSFLIGHVGYWGYVFDNYIFPDAPLSLNSAAKHLDLCKSALKKSLRITLHSDSAVTPLGPLRYMEQAITRIMEGSPQAKTYYEDWKKNAKDLNFRSLTVLNENERISTVEALKAVTIDAAWQCQADPLVGSLLPEKLADFIILDENPMLMDTPEKAYLNMRDIKVLETWVGGVKLYSKDSK